MSTIETDARAAIASVAREHAAQSAPAEPESYACRTDAKATPKQLYRIARETLELLGIDWPSDRRAASELIGQLTAANRERAAAGSAGSMPF